MAIKWITPPSAFSNISRQTYTSLEEKFLKMVPENYQPPQKNSLNIPAGMPAFLLISASGLVRVCYYKTFGDELWGVLTTKLRFPLEDFISNVHISTSNNSILLYTTLSAGNIVTVYNLSLDLFQPALSNSLIHRIYVGQQQFPVSFNGGMSPMDMQQDTLNFSKIRSASLRSVTHLCSDVDVVSNINCLYVVITGIIFFW